MLLTIGKGNIMVRGWKARRDLALYVSLALSCGGYSLLAAPHACGASVVIDASHPGPTPVAAGNAHRIPAAGSHRNVTGNTLTVNGVPYQTVYGGFTYGGGNVTGNTLILQHTYALTPNDAAYGGWSQTGNATYNTVVLNSIGDTNDSKVYGGASGNGAADVTTGNTLRVMGRENAVYSFYNFEKLEFDLNSDLSNYDYMLSATGSLPNTRFDWGNVNVRNLPSWARAMAAAGVDAPQLALYQGDFVTLTNYTPTFLGTGGTDYEFQKSAIGVLPGTTMAQGIMLNGNRYQNAGKGRLVTTPNTTLSGSTPYETYAGISFYGSTANHNELNLVGGNHIAARAGYAAGENGGAEANTLNLETGARVTNGYAGYTTGVHVLVNPADGAHPGLVDGTKNADAKGNTLNIRGGTLNAGGSLYGGYIATNPSLSQVSAGDASGNTVNIESGTFDGGNAIYGGYTEGTGKATGNTINIGSESGTYSAPTLGNVTLYGGGGSAASDVVTGNTLNVYDSATAANIRNFDSVRFKLTHPHHVPVGGTFLTLTSGTTTLDWKKIHVDGLDKVTASATDDRIYTLLHNGNGIHLANYDTTGTRDRITASDYEVDMTTAGNSATTTDVYLRGFRFRNNTDAAYAGATATAAWGGRSIIGNTVENNTLTLTGGNSTMTARGGMVENTAASGGAGDAARNKLLLNTGAQTGDAYGAEVKTAAGSARENTAALNGGTVHGDLSGAAITRAGATGAVTGNKVVLQGGSVMGNVYGGHTVGTGTAAGNTVTVASATGTGAATVITGGSSAQGDAAENAVNVNANMTGDVYGGRAAHAARGNVVSIADGVAVTGNVYGGNGSTATDNVINIGRGASVTGNVTAGNATGTNDRNVVNLTGASVGGDVIGGNGADDHDNTLAVYYEATHSSSVHDFHGIKNLDFYLGPNITGGNPTLLNLGVTSKDIRGIHVGVGVNGLARGLHVDDVISLMKVAHGGTLTTDADGIAPPAPQVLVNHTEAMKGVSLLYGFEIMKRNTDELVAIVTKAAIREQTKSFVETRAAATDFINRGANLLAGPGIASAQKEAGRATAEKREHGYHLWAAMDQGDIETETGSYADTNGWNLSLGWARELQRKGAIVTFTPFVEYGRGKYDSYLGDGTHGSGHVSYLGAGLMGRIERTNGVWAETALHGGRAWSDYSGSIYRGTRSDYDGANAYYAAHFGVGKEYRMNGKDKLNTYLRYFWSHQAGLQTGIANSGRNTDIDAYDFDAVNSNRMRLGFTYTHRDSATSEIRAGLAWEYELSGTAGASFEGYDTASPSLHGGSAMLELAYHCAPPDSRFSYDLHLTGWQGVRRGVTGGVEVSWAF